MDLIDRQAAIDAVNEYLRLSEVSKTFQNMTSIQAVLRWLPSAGPKTARWVNVNEGKWNTVEVLKCTACGEIDSRMYRTDSYCPNCGAKMEGSEDGTD